MQELTLEEYDSNGIQYRPAFRDLRFAKTFLGGEDLWATFVLDRSPHLDYPDVAYGNDVILRSGLSPVFIGEMRQIEQDAETITCKALGNWIYLDDYGYGGDGRLLVDTRYGIFKEATQALQAVYAPERNEIDTNDRIYLAPRKNERFGAATFYIGAVYYCCRYDTIKRIKVAWDVALAANWRVDIESGECNNTNLNIEWSQTGVTANGNLDVTLGTARPMIKFRIYFIAAEALYAGETGSTRAIFTDIELYSSTDIVITVSDVASDIVGQIQATTPIENDTSLIDAITLQLEPLYYEEGESCYKALEDAAFFGDHNNRAIGWGVEAAGYRVYVKQPDRDRVRYVVPPEYASRLLARGQTDKDFTTEGWGKYIDEDGVEHWTAKYYAHVTSAGIVANTTPTGDDLASVVYGVTRERVIDFGRVSATLAVQFLQQYLIEHAHPQVKSSFDIHGPVQDLDKGGAWIQPYEMEMGYMVQIPHFRAVEAEGVAGSDLRDWDTTFLLVAMQYDAESGMAKLIPEGAAEDLQRLIKYVRDSERGEEKALTEKRREASFSR